MRLVDLLIGFLIPVAFTHSAVITSEIRLTDKLNLRLIADGIYLYTSDNNNGVVILREGEALAISTPATEAETSALLDWISNEADAELLGFVVNRWHSDAMGGLEIVHQRNIASYANQRTRAIAQTWSLPVPQIGFADRMSFTVGGRQVVLDYLGGAHTSDGIVV